MGSFFLTSKKASATLIFLVISILVVSSGVIITNQIKKSNDDNIKGTGLVLLDTEQDNSQYSDSSDDGTKLFTFGDSGGKSSSKKSSGGGGSSGEEPSTASEVSNDLILPEINETSDNQTFVNDTEEGENLNSSESTNISIQFSDGYIFEENGTTYIVRDSAAYVLASSDQIAFNPPLPSSICVLPSGVGERIDIRLIGSLSPTLNFNGGLVCLYADYVGADIELKIMEDDLVGDDLIASQIFHVSVNCDNPKVDYSKVFEEIILSSQFGGTADQSRIEVYGLVKLTSDYLYNLEYSTLTYDVDKLICDCLSGPCCDLSSRPYTYKPYPSQPTGYTDYYYCSGTNSPTGTNYCIKRDYYCSGNSAGYSYSNPTVDTCGICEYCTPGDPTCNYYSSSYSCGTKDCDYLDTTCRNYNDVSKYCSSGSCISPSCTSYTNTPKHTSCGTNNECDGSGACVTCTSHSYTGCWYDDVYYYDACDNREEKKLPDCGISACSDWYRDTCHGNDAYETQLCYNKGCTTTAPLGVHCYSNSYENERFVETCQYGCINGICQSNPDIACFFNRDCGPNGFNENPYCSVGGDVYDWFREWICHYAGTEQSFCSDEGHGSMIQDCPEDSYSDNYCSNDDVYQNFTDRGCLDGACFENTTAQFIYECGTEGCSDGECVYVECYNHTMCGPDNDYIGDPFCQSGDVWQDQITHTCNYPGAGNSYCSNSTVSNLKEPCGTDYCENWQHNYCEDRDVYHNRTCHTRGCSVGVCFDDEYIEEEKVEECGISEYTGSNYCYNDDVYKDYITRDCSYSSCTSSTSEKKIEDCEHGCISGRCKIEVCNYGGCYYF